MNNENENENTAGIPSNEPLSGKPGNGKTDITFILDRSGSMQNNRDDTIGSFNRFLEDQKSCPGEAVVTLNTFASDFMSVVEGVPIADVNPLAKSDYVPNGGTALRDAIGRSIQLIDDRLERMALSDRPGKVVVVIMTDGDDRNSSKYTGPHIADLIRSRTDDHHWEFVFLGANQDAVTAGTALGVSASNSMAYVATKGGTGMAVNSTSHNLREFRTGARSMMAFTPEDNRLQAQEAMAAHVVLPGATGVSPVQSVPPVVQSVPPVSLRKL